MVKTSRIQKNIFFLSLIAFSFVLSGCNPVNQVRRAYDTVRGSVEVSKTSPANGATDVPLDAEIKIEFSQDMDPATLNAKGVVVSYENEDLVVFLNPFLNSEYRYDENSKTLTITPSQSFVKNQRVQVVLTDSVKGADGRQLPYGSENPKERLIYSFRTADSGDGQDPQRVVTGADQQVDESIEPIDIETAKTIAREFIQEQSKTYKYDGKPETVYIKNITTVGCQNCYDVSLVFVSENRGYGDRSSQGISSEDATHEVLLKIRGGEVTEAFMDEKWNVFTQQFIDFE